MQVCFLEAHEMAPPQAKHSTTYRKQSSMLVIQLASDYASKYDI